MARRRSALTALKRLEASFEKQRAEIIARAKAEAVPAVAKVVRELEAFARDFPDVVRSAIGHLMGTASNGAPRPVARQGRPPATTTAPAVTTKRRGRKAGAKASPAHVKTVFEYLSSASKAAGNTEISKATKLAPKAVSAALRQIRDDGKAKSHGMGRATVWSAAK